MTFKNGESPDNRRTFEDLYDDLLKPMVNQNEKLRIAPKQEEEKIKELRDKYQSQLSERNKFYEKVKGDYSKELSKL